MFNQDFYPTPEILAHRMFNRVDFRKVQNILEPSAGKGDLIEALESHKIKSRNYENMFFHRYEYYISAIEINPDLQATLVGKDIPVIDDDFLKYSGSTHFDLIMANFPFSDGEHHLTKALDIIFCGQLVCLVNAETLRNPCTNTRKALVNRLEKLNADIEYIENAFVDAERKTAVEVALVYVNIERSVETEIFNELKEDEEIALDAIETNNELSTKNGYADLVACYNRTCENVTTHLVNFYREYKSVSGYLSLEVCGKSHKNNYSSDETLTEIMRKQHNRFIRKLKTNYWRKVTDLPEVKKYLTESQRKQMELNIEQFSCKEFTENNIRQFVLSLVKTFPQYLYKAIEELFDKMTAHALRDSRWRELEYESNIHYFNAWKTNSGYKINKRVILPFYYSSSCFSRYCPELDYRAKQFLEDLERVMIYFKPSKDTYHNFISIVDICNQCVKQGQNRKIDTRYFLISIFKKGTIHIEFKDLDLLRRFNIEACKGKNFLPMDYAEKPYNNLSDDEKAVVDNFECKESYKPVLNNVSLIQTMRYPVLESA